MRVKYRSVLSLIRHLLRKCHLPPKGKAKKAPLEGRLLSGRMISAPTGQQKPTGMYVGEGLAPSRKKQLPLGEAAERMRG